MALVHAWFRCTVCGQARVVRSTTGKNGKQIKPAGRSACILTPRCPGRTTEFVDWSR